MKKAKFDIKDVKPINSVKKCKVPALFIAARQDEVIGNQHSRDMYEGYLGKK